MKRKIVFVCFSTLLLAFTIPALGYGSGQTDTTQASAKNSTAKAAHKKKSQKPGKEMARGGKDIGKGAAKGSEDLGKGVAGGVGNLATGNVGGAGVSVGKGAGGFGKNVGMGAAKGTAKIGKGVGGEFKKLHKKKD
ncbi:MAG TPA: hypothetical protein VGX94_14815 [Terriglobia bacterium]|nr:hypothetical protein [Terriglobia bacterium]